MFAPNNRNEIRDFYIKSWQKKLNNKTLEPLEQQVVAIILEHPEYQQLIENNDIIDQDFSPESGQTNPFLHMGLHLAIREQVNTNRPMGIKDVYSKLVKKYGPEKAEHLIMDCLVESIWQSQKYGTSPDEASYLENIKRL
jgi:DnaJ-domain-containing protein 1